MDDCKRNLEEKEEKGKGKEYGRSNNERQNTKIVKSWILEHE